MFMMNKPRKIDANAKDTDKPLWKYCGFSEEVELDPKVLKEIFGEKFLKYRTVFDFANQVGITKIKNKIGGLTNCYNSHFEKALQYGWQEAFKLAEMREGREVIAIDVNSEFPYVMTLPNYTDPMRVYKAKVYKMADLNNIDNGVVLASFDFKDETVAKLYPKYFFDADGRKYYEYDQLDFFYIGVPELKYLEPYITNIRLREVYYSKQSVFHPCKNTIEFFYKKRLEYKGTPYEKIIKRFLVGIHSCTNSREFIPYEPKGDFIEKCAELYARGYLVRNEQEYELIKDELFIHKPAGTYIPALTGELYSKARLLILDTVLKLKKEIPSFELCYINIDCIHFSVDKSETDKALEYLTRIKALGNELGQFKVEARGTKGLWLCPGRYFILDKDDKLIKTADIAMKNDDFVFNWQRPIEILMKGGLRKATHKAVAGNDHKYLDKNDNFVRLKYPQKTDTEKYREKNARVARLFSHFKRIAEKL